MGKVLLVTGRLAERALRATVAGLPAGVDWEVAVMPITVAALMTTPWLARRLTPPPGTERIILPGLCAVDPAVLAERLGIPVERGPEDLMDLPTHCGGRPGAGPDGDRPGPGPDGAYDMLIVAEIHHVPDLDTAAILAQAAAYRAAGADIIDLGCKPGQRWEAGSRVIAALKAQGFRVSIDTFDPWELRMGIAAGVDLVLSVHGGNLAAVRGCTCPVVAVPDPDCPDPDRGALDSLGETAARLADMGVPHVLDPIVSPLPFGFAGSLHRYVECRRRYPAADLMLGVHHLTELLDADTTGVNAVLAGFAQELGVCYLLTTAVVPWARGAVRELDIARRLHYHSRQRGVLPKDLDDGLITLRDPRPRYYNEAELRALQAQIRDANWRIFTDGEAICVFNAHRFLRGSDPRALFGQMGVTDPGHAFYLGRELTLAHLALQLGKAYRQERPLRWGYLSVGAGAGGEASSGHGQPGGEAGPGHGQAGGEASSGHGQPGGGPERGRRP